MEKECLFCLAIELEKDLTSQTIDSNLLAYMPLIVNWC